MTGTDIPMNVTSPLTRLIQQARSGWADKVTEGLFSPDISGLVFRDWIKTISDTREMSYEEIRGRR